MRLTIGKPLRAVFAFECAITAYGGLQALLVPSISAEQFLGQVPPAPGLDFVRWIGALWLVICALELGLLWRGTREAWRIGLSAMLLGDVLHLAVHGVMLTHGGVWGLAAYTSFTLTTLFGVCRVFALLRPERVLRPER